MRPTCLVPSLSFLIFAVVADAFALESLFEPSERARAVKCQALISKVTAKAQATKAKALGTCTGAALACVQTKAGTANCDDKAAAVCTKQLASAAAAADKASAKIAGDKSCAGLSLAALLGADGLGLGRIVGPCGNRGHDVCQDRLTALGRCVVSSHDRAADALIGTAAPRTAELLAALPAPALPLGTLPSRLGCGQCSAASELRKPVEACAKSLLAATQAFANSLQGSVRKCGLGLFACVQAKKPAPECAAKATAACDKENGKVTKAVAKLEKSIAKGCGANPIAFDAASADTGLNLTALTDACAASGVPVLDGPDAVARCLAAQVRCEVANSVREAIPRSIELTENGQLGALATQLTTMCQSEATQVATAAAAPRGVFGALSKFVKLMKRPKTGTVGTVATGGRPNPSPAFGPAVKKISGPPRVTLGRPNTIEVTYARPLAQTASFAKASDPPSLIVAVSRTDLELDQHFELPLLALPEDGSSVIDEIEVHYADDIPVCAFNLEVALKIDGVVSEYASLLQVVDAAPPLPAQRTVELVTVGPGGVQQNGLVSGFNLEVSARGRYVAFRSRATNLGPPGDLANTVDVFLRDRCVDAGGPVPGCVATTEQITLRPDGTPANPSAFDGGGHVGVSAGGRFVAFDSSSPDLVPGDTGSSLDLFVRDRCAVDGVPVSGCTPVTERWAVQNLPGTLQPSISADGRHVVITTFGASGLYDVFLVDRCVTEGGAVPACVPGTEVVSETFTGAPVDGNSSGGAVSADGRFVAFMSTATNLLAPGLDTNGELDVFVRDRCVANGVPVGGCTPATERVNLGPAELQSSGEPEDRYFGRSLSISADGRFVAFLSSATNLLGPGGDENGFRDVFVRDRCTDGAPISGCVPTTERVSGGPNGADGNGEVPETVAGVQITPDGRFVVFGSHSGNLVSPAGPKSDPTNVFLRDRCVDSAGPIAGCSATTMLVTQAADGVAVSSGTNPSLSDDGRTIAFESGFFNLLPPGQDTNGINDVYVVTR